MNAEHDIPAGVDERTELLICRSLDGELTGDEFVELEGLLRMNPAARRLREEYSRIDALSVQALRRDFESSKTAAAGDRRRGIRLAAAGAVLTAAAVVALSFLPNLWTAGVWNRAADKGPMAVQPSVGAGPSGPRQFIDYRDTDYVPSQRRRDVYRDLIGVRGKNEKNQDVIYIFERNTQATRITPISGDF